jgi:hypothetical protein
MDALQCTHSLRACSALHARCCREHTALHAADEGAHAPHVAAEGSAALHAAAESTHAPHVAAESTLHALHSACTLLPRAHCTHTVCTPCREHTALHCTALHALAESTLRITLMLRDRYAPHSPAESRPRTLHAHCVCSCEGRMHITLLLRDRYALHAPAESTHCAAHAEGVHTAHAESTRCARSCEGAPPPPRTPGRAELRWGTHAPNVLLRALPARSCREHTACTPMPRAHCTAAPSDPLLLDARHAIEHACIARNCREHTALRSCRDHTHAHAHAEGHALRTLVQRAHAAHAHAENTHYACSCREHTPRTHCAAHAENTHRACSCRGASTAHAHAEGAHAPAESTLSARSCREHAELHANA